MFSFAARNFFRDQVVPGVFIAGAGGVRAAPNAAALGAGRR
jgi:hypothetical protein